jgi:hypothetical protein
MTLEFAQKEARRRTAVLGTAHFVYPTLEHGEFIVTARMLGNGFAPVYSCDPDGSEMES